ncbi:MAG TPA: isoprenylcysteine carboxylmethyltransferase family protein [Mycobacteriales bacterium]|nr:isoprenylcysteine carboxylmethyltransferase family protein [Mycobacteriales bacterium]
MALPGMIAIAGLLGWVAFEVLLRRRDDTETASWQASAGDRNSTRVLLAAYAATVATNVGAPLLPFGHVGTAWRWVGVAMVAAGLALRAWGMATLGRSYTRTLRTASDQRLVADGPYQLIRHPGYGGSLLVWIGYSLGLGSVVAVALTAVLLLGAYSWRISAEERLLAGAFGDQYTEYARRTKRLVPFLY